MSIFRTVSRTRAHHSATLLIPIDLIVSLLMAPIAPRRRDGVAEDIESARRRQMRLVDMASARSSSQCD